EPLQVEPSDLDDGGGMARRRSLPLLAGPRVGQGKLGSELQPAARRDAQRRSHLRLVSGARRRPHTDEGLPRCRKKLDGEQGLAIRSDHGFVAPASWAMTNAKTRSTACGR